jgi:hypothetical protein
MSVADRNTDICQVQTGSELVAFTNKSPFNVALSMCHANGGEMFIPYSKNDMVGIYTYLKEMNFLNEMINGIWIGLRKSDNDSVIHYNGKPHNFNNWQIGQPNGWRNQLCIALLDKWGDELTFYDVQCSNDYVFVCDLPKVGHFILRGQLPLDMSIDRDFEKNNKKPIIFYGFLQNSITKNKTDWILTKNIQDQEPLAVLPQLYPFGAHNWMFGNETYQLKLSQCGEHYFTCGKNGNCISMDQRCDSRIDCLPDDDSDEQNCMMYKLAEGYQKRTPPLGHEGSELEVKVSIQVINIITITELNFEYRVRVKVTMEWFDDRITFRNLRDSDVRNLILKEDHNDLWLPILYFDNSNEGLTTIYDMEAFLVVRKMTSGQRNDYSNLHEDFLYPGDKNPLSLSRYYSITLHCLFHLSMFPFDKQRCNISLGVPFNLRPYINIVLEDVQQYLPITMIQYKYVGLDYNTSLPASDKITVQVQMDRMYIHYLATTFLPTFCLIAIAELTLFIDITHFEATIMVALTSMLVMYTLYQSISTTLPQTGYFKMIDIWLLVGLTLPFFIIIVLIVVDSYRLNDTDNHIMKVTPLEKDLKSPERNRKGLNILKWAQYLFPLSTLVFIVIFSTVAIVYSCLNECCQI